MNRLLPPLRAALIAAALLAVGLLLLFRSGFAPSLVLFANDTPFGLLTSQADTASEAFTGHWRNLNWIGRQEIEALPGPTQLLFFLTSPVFFAKWHAPVALLFLGMSAWFYCRRSGFHPAVAIITGIAASLNSNMFSYACWGLSGKCFSLGFIFFALGLLQPGTDGWRRWARVVLAGFSVGLSVTEGADVGAIFSLYVAASVLWETLSATPRTPAVLKTGFLSLALVAASAGWIGARAVQSLTGFAIKGVQGMESSQESAAQRWDYITGWSFPKTETLRVGIAGLFGFRMDSEGGGNYWGSVGPDGNPLSRFSGSGEYAGLVVLLVALWAVARALSKSSKSPYSETERRRILFWSVVGLVSLLLAYGRFFPLFQAVFALPFLSTIRIPMKYLHGLHLSVLIVFAHGLEGIGREWINQSTTSAAGGILDLLKRWWARAAGFDRVWKRITTALLVIGIMGTVLFWLSSPLLLERIADAGFRDKEGHPVEYARVMLQFSQAEVRTALYLLLLGVTVLIASAARVFSRPQQAWWCLGLLVAFDLGRADLPWVRHYDVTSRYQSNPVIERLQAGAAQHWRMTARFYPAGRDMLLDPKDGYLPAIHNLWLEHHFQHYRIPTLDIIQMPRMPILDGEYLKAFAGTDGRLDPKRLGRLWQLTSTRFLLGALGVEKQLDTAFAVAGASFKPVLSFGLQPKPGVTEALLNQPDSHTAVITTNGPYAILEYSAALPRALVLHRWSVESDPGRAGKRIVSTIFNPASEVLVDKTPYGLVAPTNAPDSSPATIVSYKPRHVVITTAATQAGVLLLNDRWHEHWHATVDGTPADILHANFAMRGVALPAGQHTVEFHYDPPHDTLTLTLSAFVVALLLLGALALPPAPPEEF